MAQPLSTPVIAPNVPGGEASVTASVCGELFPQKLSAVTEILPCPVPSVACMLLVVEVPLHPVGKVHVYEVAPLTAVTEKVLVLLAQTLSGPIIAAGVIGGTVSVMLVVCAVEFPQVLPAVTEMVPPPVPSVAIIELVVEVPLHPDGKIQVYEVAPVTNATE